MNWIVRFYLILIFLCGTFSVKSQGIYHRADSLFMAGDFHQSGLAYEWIIFSDQASDEIPRAFLGRVQSFKQLGMFDEASAYLDQISIIELPDSLEATFMYESLLVNFLAQNYQEVQSRYMMFRPYLNNSGYNTQAGLLLCLSQLKSRDWNKLNESASLYIRQTVMPERADSLVACFNTIFDTLRAPRYKNPKTARIMSMIVPGSGQIYSGHIGEGAISLSLHILAAGGAALAFSQGLYISGWIGGFGLLQKLYFGGTKKAAELCEQKNRLNEDLFIQPVYKFLISIAEQHN